MRQRAVNGCGTSGGGCMVRVAAKVCVGRYNHKMLVATALMTDTGPWSVRGAS